MKNVNNSKDREIWKDIKGYEGLYSVSNKGNIKNLKTNKILAGGNSSGYRNITLKGKTYMVHRLVALAFIDNPQNLPQVDHRDENKKNNDVSNLRWVSKSENTRHSIYKQSLKIKQLDKDGNLIRIWPSVMQIERELGYNRCAIVNVCRGRQRSAYNFRWEYADKSQQRKFNRPVAVYKDGEYIGTFANAAKAAEALGLKYKSVIACLKGYHATLHGYTFSYK